MMDQGRIPEGASWRCEWKRSSEKCRNTQEIHHQSKWLTHQFQIKLQKECILRIETAQRCKFEQYIQKIEEEDNPVKEIEMKLLFMFTETMTNQVA